MATIKTTDSKMMVDTLGLQLVSMLAGGSTVGFETVDAVGKDMAAGGATPGQDETVDYNITPGKMTETISEQQGQHARTTAYTLTGSNLNNPLTAQGTKLTVSGTVRDAVVDPSSSTTTKTTGTVTLTGNPYDIADVTVTKATYTMQLSGDFGQLGKGGATSSVSFSGVEQYGVDGLSSILVKDFSASIKSNIKIQGATVSAQQSFVVSSASGLSYDNVTGAISGTLDRLTFTSVGTANNQLGIPASNDHYTSGAFTADMLDALSEAVFATGDFVDSYAARKAAIFGGDDIISGSTKNALYIEAGAGNDTVTGGAAADTLYGDEGNDKLFGQGGNDVLFGGDGDDVLDGGAGVDTMLGGNGNDTYIVDSALELGAINLYSGVVNADSGTDTVRITYKGGVATNPVFVVLGANANLLAVENVQIAGTGVFWVTGNGLDNVLDAGKTASLLIGGLGDDTYYINAKGADALEQAGAGNDSVISSISFALIDNLENLTLTGKAALNGTGNAQANLLIGNDGANILDGGAGADSLAGGKGNDTYIVDNLGDSVTEGLNAGTDTVKSSVSFTLGANLENLTLTGTAQADTSGTGNELNNIITGDAGANRLDGRGGVDKLAGGDGDDSYFVDLIAKGSGAKATVALEDTVTEKKGQGDNDALYLAVSQDTLNKLAGATKATTLTLGANLENLDASNTGSLKLNLTGNAANNALIGNDGDNVLNGGAGNDFIAGGDGDDLIIGGLGTDTLFGGAGADTFSFTSIKDLGLNDTQDEIQDFTSGEDLLSFKGFKGWTFDTSATAATGAKQLWAVVDGSDTIVYGNSGGTLDADFSIKLTGVTTLAGSDIVFA